MSRVSTSRRSTSTDRFSRTRVSAAPVSKDDAAREQRGLSACEGQRIEEPGAGLVVEGANQDEGHASVGREIKGGGALLLRAELLRLGERVPAAASEIDRHGITRRLRVLACQET